MSEVPASVAAALEPDPRLVERALSERVVWEGSFFDVSHVDVVLPDGERRPREIVRHTGGAGVVAIDEEERICLVRQWRVPQGRVTVEIPAGKLDEGETPRACAARELAEEAGLVAEDLVFLAATSGIPGFSDELTRVFWARGLSRVPSSPDADEFVDVVWLPAADVLEAVRQGAVTDVKTVVAVLAWEAGLCRA